MYTLLIWWLSTKNLFVLQTEKEFAAKTKLLLQQITNFSAEDYVREILHKAEIARKSNSRSVPQEPSVIGLLFSLKVVVS